MNSMLNKMIQSVVIYLMATGSCVAGQSALAPKAGRIIPYQNVDLNAEIVQADVILIGKLKPIGSKEHAAKRYILPSGVSSYYRIEADEIFKGRLPEECYFVDIPTLHSSYGPPPQIENYDYMVFLQKVTDKDPIPASKVKEVVFYRLVGQMVGNWHGIIALNKEASERRSVESITEQYGIDVQKRRGDFLDAMRYILKEPKQGTPKTDLSPGAFSVYEALKIKGTSLQPREKKPEGVTR